MKNSPKEGHIEENESNGKPTNGAAKTIIGVLNGNFFTSDKVIQNLPFMLFLSFIALLYIANGYMAEGTIREINDANTELKELRSEYITTKSELMYKSKQSQVASALLQKETGIMESAIPPYKIVVSEIEFETLNGVD